MAASSSKSASGLRGWPLADAAGAELGAVLDLNADGLLDASERVAAAKNSADQAGLGFSGYDERFLHRGAKSDVRDEWRAEIDAFDKFRVG